MTLFIDLYFLVNFIIDYLSLAVTAKILHLSTRCLRLLASSAIGALYCCFTVILNIPFVLRLLFFVLIPYLMLILSFSKAGLRATVKQLFIFFGVSLIFGGGCQIFFERSGGRLSFGIFFVLASILFFVSMYFFDIFSLSASVSHIDLDVKCGKRYSTLHLLCDSGNLLHDPFEGLPVILIRKEKFDSIFPHNILYDSAAASTCRLRLIPVKTAVGKSLIPAAFASLTYSNNGRETSYNALLGRCDNSDFAGFDGIFPQSLL